MAEEKPKLRVLYNRFGYYLTDPNNVVSHKDIDFQQIFTSKDDAIATAIAAGFQIEYQHGWYSPTVATYANSVVYLNEDGKKVICHQVCYNRPPSQLTDWQDRGPVVKYVRTINHRPMMMMDMPGSMGESYERKRKS